MTTRWTDPLTRRTLLKVGLSGAALLALPAPWRRPARAEVPAPHFLVTLIAQGGWDPTLTLDPHDPADPTDGIDVDVPGTPPSAIRSVGGLIHVSNPATRPAVDAFFDRWAGRAAVVNGIHTRSTSHTQSEQLVLTGYLDPTRADFAVMAAHHNGTDMPLPHLLVSGASFGGPFAGLSGRVGGQMSAVLDYNRIPGRAGGSSSQLGVSAGGEARIHETLASEWLLAAAGPAGGRLPEFQDASARADRLVQLASSLPRSFGNGTALATSLGGAFRAAMTTSVTVRVQGGFDTHDDNTQQDDRWNRLFAFLGDFVAQLAAEPGVTTGSLLDETTIVCCSEFGRTPRLNDTNGKDHHPWTSMLFVGKRVRPAATVGMTDGAQKGVRTSFDSGRPDDGGQVIDVQNVVAGILTLVGANSGDYLPSVRPLTAMIAA
jgi:uncharacterized protein (DUF1501 family)